MINKVGLNLNGFGNKDLQNKQPKDNKFQNEQHFDNHLNPQLLKNYYVPSFTARESSKPMSMSKEESINYLMSTPAKKMMKNLRQSAFDTGYDHVTVLHVMKNGIERALKYIDDLDSGEKDFDVDTQPPLAMVFYNETSYKSFSDPENRKKMKPILLQELDKVNKLIEENKPETPPPFDTDKITMSDDLVDSVYYTLQEFKVTSDATPQVTPYVLLSGAYNSPVPEIYDMTTDLLMRAGEAIMVDKTPNSKRISFSEYEKKASDVLKNLALGTNIFVTYDMSKDEPKYFINSIHNAAENSEYGKNAVITELNSQINEDYMTFLINKIKKDKKHEHILILNPLSLMLNSSTPEQAAQGTYAMPQILIQMLMEQPPNVKYIFYETKNNYYGALLQSAQSLFKNFEELTVPALSTQQMIKSFRENPDLMKDIKKPFTKNAIDKTVEASAQLDGAFPEKTRNLMKKIVSYYIRKKEITEKDVANYVKEATNLFKKGTDDSSVEVVFDTEKRIKQMVGKDSTKKEAMSLVKQIKSNKMGTKGVLIYSQDGSAGSGRRFTAQAIAGEAKVPYIEINTMDFGTKEVGIFGGAGLSPEASMKKLFSVVTTQAEANSNKSAVLFIENFEYFSIGELISQYHQKAMAQLLREMDKAEKEGLNILVVGSVSSPQFIGEAAMKSFKFVDSIEVSSPAFNEKERADILADTVKKSKMKLAGTPAEQKAIIDSVAHYTMGFPNIYLKNVVKKARSVALERSHKAVTKGDFTEAYLQITTGRPSTNKINEHEKQIVTSHECGHATNLEVMNNLMRAYGKPWQLPGKVDFVTLDPRGWFGGAVYHGDDKNEERSFEKVFSDIVCAYGGHSAEKLFYDMDGSYGISADLESATRRAEVMVKTMGQGARTGKMSLDGNNNISPTLRSLTENDMQVILRNALTISDLITDAYADFNREFTNKYSHLVGTGDCLIDGDVFRKELNDWKARQTPQKQEELRHCDELILDTIKKTKKGVLD